MEQQHAPRKIGDVDLRYVITDRPPPVRVPDNPLFEAPPVPTLVTAQPKVRMKTFVHTSEPPPQRVQAPAVDLDDALDQSLAPAERLLAPEEVAPRTWGHPGLWVLAAFFAAAAITAALVGM